MSLTLFTLSRLATNNDQFLTRILGIKSATHRSKITIKAMDIVLFGPPKGKSDLKFIRLYIALASAINIRG